MRQFRVQAPVAAATFVVISFLTCGCGGNGVPVVPVEGRITFNGRPPPTFGKIFLVPVEPAPGMPRRPGRADFGADGAFTMTTFTEGDGLIPGKYLANIECWREKPTLETKFSANYVPQSFRYECTIDPDSATPVVLDIDVPVSVGSNPSS